MWDAHECNQPLLWNTATHMNDPNLCPILIQGNYLAPTTARPSLHNVLNSCVNLVWCVRWPLISRPVISESAIFQIHTLNTENMRNIPGEISCSLTHPTRIIKPGKWLHGEWLPAWLEVIDVNVIMQKTWFFEDFWRPAFRLFSTRVSDQAIFQLKFRISEIGIDF